MDAEQVALAAETTDTDTGATAETTTEAPVTPPSVRESAEAAYEALSKPDTEKPPKKEPVVTKKPVLKVDVKSHVRTIRPGERAQAAARPNETTETAPPAETVKPPANWTAQEREHWGKLPVEAQKAVIRAEKVAQNLVRATKEAAAPAQKFVGMLSEAARPYAAVIQAEGSNPVHAFTQYLQTATVLRQGSPQAKATMIANLIHQFGVPVEALATNLEALMAGKTPPGGGTETAAQRTFDPNAFLAEAERRLEAKLAQREEAQRLSSSGESVAEFGAKKEFFNDVREEMADILELHAARMRRLPPEHHVALDLEDVYDRACRSNAEVSQVYLQRLAAEEAKKNEPALQATRRAASSIRSKPAGNIIPRKPNTNDVRASAEAAYEQLMGGA